jgi:diguanylate cyclase (GGDEF)-like protein/PAS domain S-box-containing protein
VDEQHVVLQHLVQQHVVLQHLVQQHVVLQHLVQQHVVLQHLVQQHLVRERLGVTLPIGNRDRAVRRICWGWALLGAFALAVAAYVDGWSRGASWWLVLGFVVALSATHLAPLHLTHREQSEALHVDEILLVPMFVLLSSLQVMVAFAVALTVASISSRRGLQKGLFNVGMITASIGLGCLVAHALGVQDAITSQVLAAGFVGGFVHCTSSAAAVSVIIGVATGRSLLAGLRDGARLRLATWVGSLSFGTFVVGVAHGQPWLLAMAAFPLVALQLLYAGALGQWREKRRAEALYVAAGRIHGTVESDAVRAELLASARDLLAAGVARIVPVDEPPAVDVLRADLGDGSAVEVADRATGGTWTPNDDARLQALAAVARGALANALLFEQMQAITRSLGEGVLALDEVGTVTFANPAAESLLGWRRGELVGRQIAESVDPEGRDDSAPTPEWVHLPRLRAGETLRIDEHVVTRRDGSSLDVALTASPVVRDGDVVGAVVVFRDVRDRKALERRLVHQAFHDPLTGLPNRALFLDRLEHARARSMRDGGTQAVLFLDVDRFKVINDSLGHRTGDQVLQSVASRLVGVLRPSDTVARFGGDEFTVLLEQVVDASEAAQTAERILRVLQHPMEAGDRDVVITASIGIAIAEPGNAPGDLLAAADIAMYQAKSRGKNRYVVASPDADERALARLDLEMELRRAIDEGELELQYQPVVDAKTGRLYGLEALVRWRHPSLGLLGPEHFMDVAEDTGLVLPLGDWVLEQACVAAVEWQHRHADSPIVMAVNLSARQFQQPDLCERVAQVLRSTGLDPSLLALEITETAVMEDTTATLATLRNLKQLKVRLSIDDFGTGYSSLSYLKRFPVDAVKIDKSFVAGLTSGPVDREIVQAVIRLAAAVGMQTIAEGVETTAQCEQLRVLGCTMLQGFLLSRPGPMEEVERLVALGSGAGVTVPAPRAGELTIRL